MDKEEMKALAIRAVDAVSTGTREEIEELYHPDAYNREADLSMEKPEAAGRGPDAIWMTAQWLQSSFDDLRHDVREAVVDGDLVVFDCLASGRHVGDMPLFNEQGELEGVLKPTGKRFATMQTHWVRIKDGKAIEHWARRDDLRTAQQLGWLPTDLSTYIRTDADVEKVNG